MKIFKFAVRLISRTGVGIDYRRFDDSELEEAETLANELNRMGFTSCVTVVEELE